MAEHDGMYEGSGGGYRDYRGGAPPPQHRGAGFDGYGNSRSQVFGLLLSPSALFLRSLRLPRRLARLVPLLFHSRI